MSQRSLVDGLWSLFYRANLVPYIVSDANVRTLAVLLLPLATIFLSFYFAFLRGLGQNSASTGLLSLWKRKSLLEYAPFAAVVACTVAWFSVLHVNGEGVNLATLATVNDQRSAANAGINSIVLGNLWTQTWRAVVYCGLWETVGLAIVWLWHARHRICGWRPAWSSSKKSADVADKDAAWAVSAKDKASKQRLINSRHSAGAAVTHAGSSGGGLGLHQRLILAFAHAMVAMVSHPLAVQLVMATTTIAKPRPKRRVAFISPAFIGAHSTVDRDAVVNGSVIVMTPNGVDISAQLAAREAPKAALTAERASQPLLRSRAETGITGETANKTGVEQHDQEDDELIAAHPLEKGEFLLSRYIHRPSWRVFTSQDEYLRSAVPGAISDARHAFSSPSASPPAAIEASDKEQQQAQEPPLGFPNIVIVFAEGLDRFSSNSNGRTGFPGLMPHLMELEASETLSFQNLAVPFGTGWSFAAKTSLFCGHPYTMPRQEDVDGVYLSVIKEDHHWLIEDEKIVRRDIVEDHERMVKNGSWAEVQRKDPQASRTPFPTPVPTFVPKPAPQVPDSWFHRSFSDVVNSYIPGSTCMGDILAATGGYYGEFLTGCTVNFAGVGRLFQDHGFQSFVDRQVYCPSQNIWNASSKMVGWGYPDSDVFGAARSRIDALKRARQGLDHPLKSGVAGSAGGLNHSFDMRTYNKLLGVESPPALPFTSATHPLTKKIYPGKGVPFIVTLETADMHDGDWSPLCEDLGLTNYGADELVAQDLQDAKDAAAGKPLPDRPSALRQALEMGRYDDSNIVRTSHCFSRLVSDFARSVADKDTMVLVVGDHHPHNALQKDLFAQHVKEWLQSSGGPAPVYPSAAVPHPEAPPSALKPGSSERHYGHAYKPTLFAALLAPGRVQPGRMVTRPGALMDLGPTLLQLAGIQLNPPSPVDTDGSRGSGGGPQGLGFGRSLIAPVRGPEDMTLRELMALPPPPAPQPTTQALEPGAVAPQMQPCARRQEEQQFRRQELAPSSSILAPSLTAAAVYGSNEPWWTEEWCAVEQWDELEKEMEAFCFDPRVKQLMWQPGALYTEEVQRVTALSRAQAKTEAAIGTGKVPSKHKQRYLPGNAQ